MSVPILIQPQMLQGRKTPTTNHLISTWQIPTIHTCICNLSLTAGLHMTEPNECCECCDGLQPFEPCVWDQQSAKCVIHKQMCWHHMTGKVRALLGPPHRVCSVHLRRAMVAHNILEVCIAYWSGCIQYYWRGHRMNTGLAANHILDMCIQYWYKCIQYSWRVHIILI